MQEGVMVTMRALAVTASLLWVMAMPLDAQAETSQNFGGYTVHYNAFTTDSLQPSMAKAYNIARSKNRALLTISILKPSMSPVGTPVRATVTATASNLNGQLKNITIREVDEGTSVYYLSEFSVANEEVLDFQLSIKPTGEDKTFEVKFRQQFFTQ
jgi:hypothetical protein